MKTLLFCIALIAMSLSAPSSLFAAEDGAKAMQMECCNTTCAVCDKPVDKAVAPATMKSTTSTKITHPEMEGANVGFCSMTCKTEFEKDPAKYEEKVFPQWQFWKNKRVK